MTPGFSDIHIEGATYCDARCICCPHDDIVRSGIMDWRLFTKIVDEAVELGCWHFLPFRVNEPFLDPDIFRRLEYFRKAKVPVVQIFSNGNSLDEETRKKITEYADVIKDITFSFHGGTPESYKRTTGLDFNRVYENILKFVEMDTGINIRVYCLHWSTTKDVESEFKKLWDGINISEVSIQASMEWGGDRLNECTVASEVIGRSDIYRIPCPRLMNQLDIMVDGTVALCCVDGHGIDTFGNLNDLTIDEVWNSYKRESYRNLHRELKFDQIPMCTNCSVNIRG